MAIYLSNRDGDGLTDEQGHYRFNSNVWSGNFIGDSLRVRQNDPLGMSVLISEGDYKIDRADGYSYMGWNDDNDHQVTIATADGSNPRIDAIVIYVDLGEATDPSPSNNPGIAKTTAVAGTPAGSPTAPDSTAIQTAIGGGNPYQVLAYVTVPTSATQITTSNINDARQTISAPQVSDWLLFSPIITRTGNHEFTVVGDKTAIFRKGVRIRYRDGGSDEYGVIASSSHSAGVTTVNLIVNSDYSMAAATITDVYISTLTQPVGFPAYFNWSPTYTASGSMTYGSVTTSLARWWTIGQTLYWSLRAVGTTGGSASTDIFHTVPVQSLSAIPTFSGVYGDSSARGGSIIFFDSTPNKVGVNKQDLSPWGLGTNRRIDTHGFYQF